ncbi:3-deoxy-7-phosphoheptulonate synthase [Jeotgalibaca porci]|uniref:3-deoxy-7-phosphoheptulonate synthase n=1 Tax=Jeotgalibaca porci TaxID=1868793 RepID=A0A6G7WF12_9LACT|nr:3-deoxy-7-phosphoheptulonate synthase [Jeotgalibaca porci]QIK50831.1 3-deoxy-7-phosphoheptulonate synthase [Jeotgalibaca porci]
MIIVMKRNASANEVKEVMAHIKEVGLNPVIIEGTERDVIGVTGDTATVDIRTIRANKNIVEVLRVSEPYKLANRAFHPENTQIKVDNEIIGGKQLAIIAGPCSVESEEQIVNIAKRMKAAGANFIRGGAFKPRTSPYSFQGLELEGLRLLELAKKETGMPIVSELMSTKYLDEFVERVDVIQIGARNMQNFDLLKEIGKTQTPILLKRGLSATYKEWLMSAEYIMSEGNGNVILCERGIRTFETETRNTLDIQAIPVLQRRTHLPIIIDPSHAGGESYLVPAGAKAGVAAGADGLMIETHEDPANAWSDGEQCLTPDEFDKLMEQIRVLAQVEDRTVAAKLN